MDLILPIAGRSSRFPEMRPKWMLTHPKGRMMVVEAVRGLDLSAVKRIIFVGLAEHESRFGFVNALRTQFEEEGIRNELVFVLLETETRHQPETVLRGIEEAGVSGPFFVKDSDNYFKTTVVPGNRISCFDLHSLEHVNARNKSYLQASVNGVVTNIVEKKIISSTFCVGGYGFESVNDFKSVYHELDDGSEIYLSNIIFAMILKGSIFKSDMVTSYLDWGTLNDWNAYKSRFSTLFVDLDGTLVKNSGQYTDPKWGETDAIESNVKVINALYDSGNVEIIITTSRNERFRQTTISQLQRHGIKFHQIIFGLVHGRRIVINDYAKSNPYKSCDAINIRRDGTELREMLEESIGFSIHID
jgi:hypothetical protein